MKTLIKILLTMAAILAVMGVISCHRLEDITPQSLGDSDIYNLKQVEDEMVDEQTFESHVDKKILQAVKQMVKTLKPEFKDYLLGKYKLGFLEVSDIDRQNVTMLHNYITEKTLTFSFLQPEIATNFSIVERFLLKNVTDELKLQNQGGLREERIIDQRLAQQLGRIYHLDVIETGVTTESSDFIDINLRMIETKRGRIVAVGSVKIEKTAPVRKWLEEMGK